MATYYRWRKSTISYQDNSISLSVGAIISEGNNFVYQSSSRPSINQETGTYTFSDDNTRYIDNVTSLSQNYFAFSVSPTEMYRCESGTAAVASSYHPGSDVKVERTPVNKYTIITSPGAEQGYVYSTSSSAYPNGGVQDGYYYDQRTTVTSPTAPANLQYPNPITTPTVTVSWDAATSNTDYPVESYEVKYQQNSSGTWITAGTTSTTTFEFNVPVGTTELLFQMRAKDSNGQYGPSITSIPIQVVQSPTLTVPQMVMQGQQATISWSAIEGADSYTLQRKANTDADWTQVYSGANLSYTETAGTWTSLQYRVQAVFDGTPGGWATSDPIQIVSASALVISGQDGDLGTLVNDVQYSISSDQTSPTIDVTVEVNGGEYASFQATSGQTYKVGVLDLPTGTGSIVITASTEVSSSPVTVTRTWTYSKTAQTFPNSGSVATLTQEGNVVYPETLTEAVRTAMNPWGGNLSTALNLLKNAALFNRTSQPKYSEVTVNLAEKSEGDIISLPENGRMVEFYVAKLDYESALNGAGRVLLVRKDCYDERAWDAGNVNAWASSDLLTWLNGTYKGLFPEEVQTAMGTTTYYYTPGNGDSTVTTRSDAVFQASATELGKTGGDFNSEGSALPIANTLGIAYRNGSRANQWTRSPDTSSLHYAWELNVNGIIISDGCVVSHGSRPCFTLPSTFTYGPVYVAQDGTIHASQEYTEAGDWLDVWGNAIPAVKIETGSYVGTGTYGESNPNTLTFGFEPKLVFIATENQENVISRVATAPLIFGTNFSSVFYVTSSPTLLEGTIYLQWDKNAIEFYNAGSAYRQLNSAGETYRYVALG